MDILQLIIIIGLIPLGFGLRKGGVVKEEHAGIILKYVFLFLVPILLLATIPRMALSLKTLLLPTTGILIALGSLVVAWVAFRRWENHQERGVALIGAMIANTGFVIPFVITLLPPEALPYMLLVDTGGALMTFTLAYGIACAHSGHDYGLSALKKFFSAPPLWALMVGILMNSWEFKFPEEATSVMLMFGKLAGPFIAFALGVRLSFAPGTIQKSVQVIAVRILGGGAIALALVLLFNLEGIARTVVLLGGLAPVGYNSLIFAAEQKLSENLAAQVVSLSLLISLLIIPIVILALR